MRTALMTALLYLICAAPAAVAQDAFTVDHAIDMTRVGGVEVSPDGARVLYTVTELDWADNERDTRLWIADADGSDARPFTAEEGDGGARWSPDGRWIAFLRGADEESDADGRQLWLIRTDGGEARQLTSHPASVRSYEWTPDSRGLVFVASDTLSDEEEKRREAGYDGLFVNEGPNGQTRGRYSNLWWVPADFEDAEARPVTEGDRMIGDFAVAPDGRRVAFTFRTENHRNDEYRSEIALVEIVDGADALGEITVLTDNAAPESSLQWHPDGRLLFRAPSLETWELDQGNLYLMDPATGEVEQLMPESTLDVRSVRFTPDGRYLDLTALDRTVSNFYRLDLRSGRLRVMSEWAGTVGGASWSREHDVVAFTFDAPASPAEVYTAGYGRGMERRAVTDVGAEIRSLSLAAPEVVRWRSTDGLEIEGLLWLPPGGRDRPGAFVLEIHGGPAGVFTRGFDSDAQLLAAHGYAILQPNVRGSTGYGDALLRGNMRDIGGGDYDDLMTGVDAMIDRGVAHPDSMAVKGWSYGGILGGWTITQTDRFRAASLGAMVSDWISEFGVGFNFDVSLWYLGENPWTNEAMWRNRSAYTHADQVSTPTILFHGENDRTDTPGQSMNFHAALRLHGVPNRFILFPREGHGIREPRHHRTRLVEELRWFERYVRGNEAWEAPARPDDGTEQDGAEEESVGEDGAP
ncbi:MAG: S9 family peptidase [Longimicrobiales bacterium]|nr:S9 family peptidase [Longimicrobiales bacterium]